ncbi:glycosyltransferase family 39 protein [Streptomyces sp. NPDC058691]|uniref:ArnT family glycosyltransferase n=1 Tax=Streptomyces sp. NPDC058691 TaxID=3346601 RepID=UPI0036661088
MTTSHHAPEGTPGTPHTVPPVPGHTPAAVHRTPVPADAPPPGATGRSPVPQGAPPPLAVRPLDTGGAAGTAGTAGIAARLWRGRPEDPRWARPAFLALLALTAVVQLWDLGASGWANSFYSAAVQAGAESWKAFFFGSSDAGNSITVDKPPAALWPMALSVRVFGLSSWSVLVPEALMGVAAVGVLYAAVRRRFSAAAGLIAGLAFALTPVAALMFRFNNPDALLCLLMVVAVYCVLRALEDARTKWLVLAGVAFGLAFLTKTLQAWLILPPPAVVYAVCAPTRVRRRFGQIGLAGLAAVVSGGWWVAIVELWPASSRPYIGGSQDNSFLSLTFGYNGFGRITGDETGSVGGGAGPGGGGQWGETGWGRLFGTDMGGQIAWLLPAAFVLLVAGLWLTRRAPRADARRSAFLVWGGALVFTFLTFSFMSGIFHQYYNIALAPYIAALVGMGATLLWERRRHPAASAVLAATVLVTAVWSCVLLGRSADWYPWVRYAVLVAGIAATLGLLLAARLGRHLALAAAALGLAAALGGPLAYTLQTIGTPHTGSIVTAGPAVQGGMGGMRRGTGGFPGGMRGGTGGFPGGGQGQQGQQGFPGGGTGGFPGGGQGQQGFPGGPQGGSGGTGRGGAGGLGGLLNGATVSDAAKNALLADADRYTWVAAAIGSQNAASYQLATNRAVMAIGGFNGSDPSPTLDRFKNYVAQGRIHYFIASGGMGGGGRGSSGNGTASQISSWVEENFGSTTLGGVTVYDLTDPS